MSELASQERTADAEFEQRFGRIEGMLAELSRSADASTERLTRELLSTVLELHRRGLERTLQLAAREDTVREALARDARVSAMLLLHGLHPITLDERVSRTLDVLRERFRSKLESAGYERRGDAAFLVRLVPAASACASTRSALKKDWEDALLAAVPDAEAVVVELAEPAPALVTLRRSRDARAPQPAGGAR